MKNQVPPKHLFICLQKANQLSPSEAKIAIEVLEKLGIKKAMFGYSINDEENLHGDTFEVINQSKIASSFFIEYPLLDANQFYKLSLEKMDSFFNSHEDWSNYPHVKNPMGLFTPSHQYNTMLPEFLEKNNIRFGTSPTHFIDMKLKAKMKIPLVNINWDTWLGRLQFQFHYDKWVELASSYKHARLSLDLNDLLHPKIAELFSKFYQDVFSQHISSNTDDLQQLIDENLKLKKDKLEGIK